ncbi:hypothetical protein G846_02437 [Escherichia coli HVH 194 (4-2356805)]|nr:hypothetical protein G846_02437 [Escherichia coli HVH 194 (4-2356805)]
MPVSRNRCIFLNVGLGEGAPTVGGPLVSQTADMGAFAFDTWCCRLSLKYIVQKCTVSGNTMRAISGPVLASPHARRVFSVSGKAGAVMADGCNPLTGESSIIIDHANNSEWRVGTSDASRRDRFRVISGRRATCSNMGIVQINIRGLLVPFTSRVMSPANGKR